MRPHPPLFRIYWILSYAAALLLCLPAIQASTPPVPRIENAACELLAPDGRPLGWQVTFSSGGQHHFGVDRSVKFAGEGSLHLANAEGGARYLRIYQSLELAANTRYRLTAQVRSTIGQANVNVVPDTATWFGDRSFGPAVGVAAGNDWRPIEKRWTTTNAVRVHLVWTLITPNRQATDLWIDDLQLMIEDAPPDSTSPRSSAPMPAAMPTPAKVDLPAAARRSYPQTSLVVDRQPTSAIVYPAAIPHYHRLAERLQAAIHEQTGATLPLFSDIEVTEAQHPILQDAFREKNLILLGRLGINRAFWGVYNRFLCATDGYYPGGDGYELRTAANVYATGANSILLGGSSEAGVERAVERLLTTIAEARTNDGDLLLPWLLEVELGGRCAEVFDAEERSHLQRGFHLDARIAPAQQFYENAMRYYWSGRAPYLDLARQYLQHLLARDNPAPPGGHYLMEFFVRAIDMLDDSGLFDPETLAGIDQLILQSFQSYAGGREAGYRTALRNPLHEVKTSDHPNASWLADKVMADFILQKLPLNPETAAIRPAAQQRRALHQKTFDHLIQDRWRACDTGYASADVVTRTLFRYALEMERYSDFFDSGNARRAALYHLARILNPSGSALGLQFGRTDGVIEFDLFLAIVASYHGDGPMKQVLETLPRTGRVHSGVIVSGIHTYRPGPEVPLASTQPLQGLSVLPLVPVHHQRLAQRPPDMFRATSLPYDETFNLATFRGGFENEDYLLIAGAYDMPAGAIARLASHGQLWLDTAIDDLYFNHNALSIRRLDSGSNEGIAPVAARLIHQAQTDEAAFLALTVPDYADTDWQRQILWLKNEAFVVLDTVTAQQADRYALQANWRPTSGALEAGRWVIRSGDWACFIATPDAVRHDADSETDPVTRVAQPIYRQHITTDLARGDSVRIANLLFSKKADAKSDYQIRRHPGPHGSLLLKAGHENDRLYHLGPLPPALGKSDAAMLVVSDGKILVFEGTRLVIGGQTLLDTPTPVTTDLTWQSPALAAQLHQLWREASPSLPAAESADALPKATPFLVPRWQYTGLQHPGLIDRARLTERNTWDLGSVAELAEIRSRQGRLPGRMETRTEPNAPWEPLPPGQLEDVPTTDLFNYGRTVHHERGHQRLRFSPRRARYVRVVSGNLLPEDHLRFYDAQQPRASDPLRIHLAPLRDPSVQDIVLTPDVWPGFRPTHHLHHEVAALSADGQERWRHTIPGRVFFARTLPWTGDGRHQLFVGSLDNRVYVYEGQGALAQTLSVEASPWPFHGHPLPASIGLWQPDATGRRKIVFPRYHATSFLQRDGSVEGSARNRSGYWTNDVLDVGFDFDGDGIEDTVAMNSVRLLTITQEHVGQETSLTHGAATGLLPLPATSNHLSGARTLAFERYGDRGTHLLVARTNMIGLCDLATGQWTATWIPTAPLSAAVALPQQNQMLGTTDDGLLWRFDLGLDRSLLTARSQALPTRVKGMVAVGEEQRDVLAATEAGLLHIRADNTVRLLAPGDFRDLGILSTDAHVQVILTDPQGVVTAYVLPSDLGH